MQEAAAAAVVILKNANANRILLIKSAKTIAVIGPNARTAVVSGGGLASLLSSYQISPLQGITEAAREIDAEVEYALGTLAYKTVPLASSLLHLSGDDSTMGMTIDFWKEHPPGFASTDPIEISVKPDYSTTYNSASAFMVDNMHVDILKAFPYIKVRGFPCTYSLWLTYRLLRHSSLIELGNGSFLSPLSASRCYSSTASS